MKSFTFTNRILSVFNFYQGARMLKNLPLLKYQKPMLTTIGKLILSSFKKGHQELKEAEKASAEFTVTPALPIVDKYHKWLNTTAKYQNTIAPHLYPQWAIPELFKLGQELSLPFHKVLNQGCKLKINGEIPKGQNLMGRVQVLDIKELETKYRINQKVWTGPKENPAAIEAEIYAVILKNNKSSFQKKREHHAVDVSKYQFISTLFISSSDAKNYGLISGDINPIHMSQVMAKLFGLKSSLMHGFGLFALIFEELERNGLIIRELEIKFLKPVYLNHNINIYVEKFQDHYLLKVLDSSNTSIHLAGSFKTKT